MNQPSTTPQTKRSPLARRLIIYIILFSATITLMTTAFQLYNEYRRDINAVELQFDQVERVHLRSFSQSLWATNYQELRIQMDGLVKLPNIIYASVVNDDKLIAEIGNPNAVNSIKRKYQIRYDFLGKPQVIGELKVIISLDNIYDELINDALVIFGSNALRTFLVVLFIYFIFYRLITRHIVRIYAHFQQISLHKNISLVLDRAPLSHPDEIDWLVDSANEMQQRINYTHDSLTEAEKKYQTLTALSPVGIFYADASGDCQYVNDKWCEITGMSVAQAKGGGWVKGLHPDDLEKVVAQWEDLFTLNKPFKLEYRFQHEDHVRWVLGQVLAETDETSNIVGYVGTITDITDRVKAENAYSNSERRLQLIHSQVPGIVYQFRLDANGNRFLPYVSPAVQKHIGITAEEVMKNSDLWFDLIHPDDFSELERTITESLLHLTPWEWEGRFIRKDGEIVWLHGTSTPEKLDDGSTLWNGLFVNVSERVKADETIRRSQKMDALGKLTGGIAHDYNNMLGVILGYAELLNSSLTDQPELQMYAKKIVQAGQRGSKLTKKLLTFSRHQSSDITSVNINNLLHDDRHMLEKTLTARIKLNYELDDVLWAVCVDNSELEDVILNIGINAMHAITGNGQLTIKTENVSIEKNDADQLNLTSGDYVRLSFIDTGCGMLTETQDKIFDPFYSTKGENGTGLGLSQVYGFIQRSHGAIAVESVLNEGAQFYLYFPRCKDENKRNSRVVSTKLKKTKGKETILMVEDESALLDLNREILKGKGYRVFCADDAKKALEILAVEKIDLLITDIIMPDMSGYELASEVQQRYPNVKIQLVSGFSGEDPVSEENNALSQNLLYKPYTAQEFIEKIQALL